MCELFELPLRRGYKSSVRNISLETYCGRAMNELWGDRDSKSLANYISVQTPEMPGTGWSSDTDVTRCTERVMKWHQQKVRVVFRLQIVRGIEVLSNVLFKTKLNMPRVVNQTEVFKCNTAPTG